MTSGDRAIWLWPWLSVIALGLVNLFVNATSDIIDDSRGGGTADIGGAFTLEATSYVLWVALAPLIGLGIRRVPPRNGAWVRFALFHAGMTILISLIHVGGMALLRTMVFSLLGRRYGFFDDGVLMPLLYEWRKDVISYAIIAAVFWAFERFGGTSQPASSDPSRIAIRDGSTAVFLPPAAIFLVESAGNYVQFQTADRVHLVRGTLAAWEAHLSEHGFVRVHRSRLVNRAHIAALKPRASGDLDITLDDGRVIMGSRRYREGLITSP